jgi:hypothetical protein
MSGVRTRLARTLVGLACGLALTACADGSSPAPTEESAVDQPPASSTTPAPGGGDDVRASVTDLAATLDVDPAEVEVVSVEEVTWRNGSRGCAKPGDMYTQALIDGSRITLRVGERTYEYHSGGSRPPALCERPTE